MKQTHTGSCHCGAVRYEADFDLDGGTFKCNCSICTKSRNWLAVVRPDSFRLLEGEDDLTEYRFGTRRIHHLFCKHCGIRSFGCGQDSANGGKFYAISVSCLDDTSDEDLAQAPVGFVDGRHDAWKKAPAETRHL